MGLLLLRLEQNLQPSSPVRGRVSAKHFVDDCRRHVKALVKGALFTD